MQDCPYTGARSSYWWNKAPRSYPGYPGYSGFLGPFNQEADEALAIGRSYPLSGYPLPPFNKEFDEGLAAREEALSKDEPPAPK